MKYAVLTLLAALAGCAAPSQPQLEGLQLDPRDYAECASQQDCTVWSGRQLQGLAQQFYEKGRAAGAKGSL